MTADSRSERSASSEATRDWMCRSSCASRVLSDGDDARVSTRAEEKRTGVDLFWYVSVSGHVRQSLSIRGNTRATPLGRPSVLRPSSPLLSDAVQCRLVDAGGVVAVMLCW